jgi:hypothetical protein
MIITGVSGHYFINIMGRNLDLLAGVSHLDFGSVRDAVQKIDRISSEELNYHDVLMDIDSAKNNILGTRVVFKDDMTVVLAESGDLFELNDRKDDQEIEEVVLRIQQLQSVSEENGAKFLYCAVPAKGYYEVAPSNVKDYCKDNYNRFIHLMADAEIPYIDFSEVLRESIPDSEIFYATDHHWKSQCGLIATEAICEELSNLYGFSYISGYTDIRHYDVQDYPDWFLGSYGKKVGLYFTSKGPDDFDLIVPQFETSLIEEEPYANRLREGSFKESVLFMSNMKKNYYKNSTYATYSGGDFRLQIIRNNMNLDGKRILLVRDSSACVVVPFFSLQTKELYVCDMRDFIPGEKMNMEEYIKEINPDYVIAFFSNVNGVEDGGKLDFF